MKRILRQLLASLLLFFCYTKAFPSEYFTSISTRPYSSSGLLKYQPRPLQFRGGITSGWNAPYGSGLDFSFLIYQIIDVNFGFGVGKLGYGTKIGLGTRFYPIRDPDFFSPMIGVYLFEGSGIDELTLVKKRYLKENDTAKYRIKPNKAVQLNVGFRTREEERVSMSVSVGYSFLFKNEEAEYLSGSTLDELRSRANLYRIGGFSINLGLHFAIMNIPKTKQKK